jgi:transposase
LKQQGWLQKDIAVALGVSTSALSHWCTRARKQGVEALAHRPPPGLAPRLSAEQRAQLPALLARGAPAYGFSGDVWTTKRVAQVIERLFRVRYHPDHVSRLVHACGWSYQRPITRATQRHAAKIAPWYEERWPSLKKGRANRARPSSG